MRIIFFSTFWTVIIDIIAWFFIHMGVVVFMLHIPARYFNPEGFLYRPRRWEEGGDLYRRRLGVKKWKSLAPDGVAVFKKRGFPKRHLKNLDQDYLQRFVIETCRAELTHWIIIAFAPWFFLWNRFFVGIIMIAYALTENVPLIVVQRYNRQRLQRVIEKTDHRKTGRKNVGGRGDHLG